MATRAELAHQERAAGAAQERARLARDIHDTLAQGLSSIQMLLQAAERAGAQLDRLVEQGVIGGYDSPARFLPSSLLQTRR